MNSVFCKHNSRLASLLSGDVLHIPITNITVSKMRAEYEIGPGPKETTIVVIDVKEATEADMYVA